MVDAFSKLIGYVLIVVASLCVVFNVIVKIDSDAENFLKDKTTDFVDECRTTGEIDPTNLRVYANTVYLIGDYDLKLEHKTKSSFSTNTSGGFITGYKTAGRDEIYEYMFPSSGDDNSYPMKNGDMLTISLVKKSGRVGDNFISFVFHHKDNNTVVVNYGGLVGYSADIHE